ncbi:transglycosylase domain-containing protein [Jeotgalibaca sp. A122]|uniref:transglycosylase domain-containing protein n=1 Tax=Jeotgalibaca sp. A122 TaxID=3457322 RepID=UPI003FD083D4
MNNSNGNQFDAISKQVSAFSKKLYVSTSLFLKDTYKQLKSNKNLHMIASKGAFGFNVTYGVVKTIMISIALIIALLGFLGAGVGLGLFASLVDTETPPDRTVMSQAIGNVELVSSLHYSNGDRISEVRTDIQRTVIQHDQISPYIIDGLISTEDEYFHEHNGIVPKAVLRALITEVTGVGATTGGSTITQQLVKQQLLTSEVTFSRKVNEMLLAMRLENYFDKDEILTAYLNVSPFGRNSAGSNVAGIEEAALGIFGVHANEVNLPQAAFLVGLPQNPYIYTPYTNTGELYEDNSAGIDRMKTVLTRMFEEQTITKEEYDSAMTYDIAADFVLEQDSNLDNHNFLYQQVEKQTIETLMAVEAEKNGLSFEEVDADVDLYNEYYFRNQDYLETAGLKVYSTIDKDIYNAMQEAAAEYAPNLGEEYIDTYVDEETGETKEQIELAQSGSVLLENTTGRVLGFIGGVDFSVDQVDHAFDAPRSPASTIKPLAVYAPAIEMNLISPASMLPDTPMGEEARDSEGIWEVSNIGEKISNKLVTAREALYQSMNNPTAKLYIEMLSKGMEPYKYMDMMDYETIDNEKGLRAFSLGTTNVTVAEQTNGFATFANHGDFVPHYLIERIEDVDGNVIYEHEPESREVFSDQTAYLTLDILRDVVDQGFSKQIKNYLNFSSDLAAKTGTSDKNTDYWFIGSTPTVTLSSWVGYNNKFETHIFDDPYFTGWPSVNNMKYWALIANKVNAVSPETFGTDQVHQRPGGIVEKSVVASTGTLPGKVTIPGTNKTVTVDGAKRTDLFKETNLPKAPTYNFSPGATDVDIRLAFWNAEEKRLSDAEAAAKKKAEEEAKKKVEQVASADKKKQDEAAKKKAEEEAKKKAEEEAKKKEEKEKTENNNN